MQNKLLILIAIIGFSGCVQKSSKKTIVVKLYVDTIKNIENVGIRGSQKPLSWYKDLKLQPIVKDSVYTTTISLVTGYKFIEAKFTVNGESELDNKDNRKIKLSDKDTIYYEAKFDVEND